MKLCGACKGSGEVNYDICVRCDGEGIEQKTTFTVDKIRRHKSNEFEVNEKRIKFDKKNAQRSI